MNFENLLATFRDLDYESIAVTAVVEEVVKDAYGHIKALVSKDNKTTYIDNNLVIELSGEDVMLQKLESLLFEGWQISNTIKFKDLAQRKQLNNVFVSLDFFVTPRSTHSGGTEERIPLDLILTSRPGSERAPHLVILGGPGAGKTTVARYINLKALAKQELFGSTGYTIPLLIQLVDFNLHQKEGFFLSLLRTLGINVELEIIKATSQNYAALDPRDVDMLKKYRESIKTYTVSVLDRLNVILILDGLDEVSDADQRGEIISAVRHLCRSLRHTKIVLTSRTGEYDQTIETAETLEISPLTDLQICEFTHKWIEDEREADDLYSQIISSPFHDAAIRPINLAHLCALYLRYKSIPHKPKEVYSKIIQLLIEDWDTQRDVSRVSSFHEFTPGRKRDFLVIMAYTLTAKYATSVFDRHILTSAFKMIKDKFELPSESAMDVFKEIESHTGLLINSGFGKYQFSHKSLQEYLSAEYLIRSTRLMFSPLDKPHMGNEYAIAICLSTESSLALFDLANRLEYSPAGDFTMTFLNRLLLERPEFEKTDYLAIAIAKLYTQIRTDKRSQRLTSRLIHSHPYIKEAFGNLKKYYAPYGSSERIRGWDDIVIGASYPLIESNSQSDLYSESQSVIYLSGDMMRWYVNPKSM